jgi:hypothetical protein
MGRRNACELKFKKEGMNCGNYQKKKPKSGVILGGKTPGTKKLSHF